MAKREPLEEAGVWIAQILASDDGPVTFDDTGEGYVIGHSSHGVMREFSLGFRSPGGDGLFVCAPVDTSADYSLK